MITVSDYARRYVRERAQDHMAATITLYRHADTINFDELTGIAEIPLGSTVVYAGKARVWTSNSGGAIVVGEAEIATISTNVSIPLDAPMPKKDDIVVVDTNPHDAVTVGTAYRVMSINGGGLIGSVRQMSCTAFTDSSFWEES